jgi:hypothetical protein
MTAIRKLFTVVEEIRAEGDRLLDVPLRKIAIVTVIPNPFAGRHVEDLAPLVEASVGLGRSMMAELHAALRGEAAESYGKAAIVGLEGEQEHGVACLTTPFGNVLREAVGGGKAWISSMTKRAAPGATIDVPLAHKDALYVRSHYDGMTLTLPDAPLPDEIAVIACVATGGRPEARLGGLAASDIRRHDGLG